MGLFQPTRLLLAGYPEGSRGAIPVAGSASTESVAASERVHAQPARAHRVLLVRFQIFRANPSGATPGLLACCLGQSSPSRVGAALGAVKAVFRGNENKSLTAISNRKSNDSRKLATLSEPTTSKFLIATKSHFSEEKAKSEEKTKLLGASKTTVLGGARTLMVERVAERGANAERVSLVLESRTPHPRWVRAVRERWQGAP
jgi:hypothetical protein